MLMSDIMCRWLGEDRPEAGKQKAGDMFYAYPGWHGDANDEGCIYWDNCKGWQEHIVVELPGECDTTHAWDINGRASNCGRPDDRTHRCWVRHGDPPNITIDKDGDTCSAGAGSIQMGDYHGFLRDGKLVKC